VKTLILNGFSARTAFRCGLVLLMLGAGALGATAAVDPAVKLAKAISMLDKKLAKTQAQEDVVELQLSLKQAQLEAAVVALADAQSLSVISAAGEQAKQKAVAKAQKQVAAAGKQVAAQQAKLTKKTATVAQTKGALVQLDPDHFKVVVAPPELAAEAQAGAVVFTWSDVPGAGSYVLAWSHAAGVVPAAATLIPGVHSPYVLEGLQGEEAVFAVVYAVVDGQSGPPGNEVAAVTLPEPEPPSLLSLYDPAWGAIPPLATIQLAHDAGLSNAANGVALAAAIAALHPGDRLVVGAGTWEFVAPLTVTVSGTATAPIRIETAPGATCLLVHTDLTSGLVLIGGTGSGPSVSYLAMRGFGATGGDVAFRLRKCSNVWIDGCDIHHSGAGIYAVDENTSHLHITRNNIHDTLLYGEGVQLGRNYPNTITHDTVVALNHIHDTKASIQGDGIDMKWRSYRNWIVRNVVDHTRYPCIIFEGTQNQPVNVIEHNLCWDSADNIMQAQGGEATVRNNLLLGPCANKLFDSTHSSADLRNLVVTHNTLYGATPRGAGLFGWNGQANMVFANNAICIKQTTGNSYALALTAGSAGGTLAGNVISGDAHDVPSGFVFGGGIKDFVGIASFSWLFAGDVLSLEPSPTSAFIGAGSQAFAESVDLLGLPRVGTLEAGCLDLH